MSELWPRISAPVARAVFEERKGQGISDLATAARPQHAQETFAATGGTRVTRENIESLANEVREIAVEFGFPDRAGDQERISFDRAAAEVVFRRMSLTTVEAANRGVWTFIAVVALPDVTHWRFGRDNLERWIASDLTRHMFSRLWWQALTFAAPDGRGGFDFALLRMLSESDLNQITERRSLGGNIRLARALGRVVVESAQGRRELIRDITPKLRRRLAFVDFSALSDEQIGDQVRSLLQ